VLELALAAPLALAVGRLGRVTLPAGLVRYYGSARGPGGLRARVARHLRRSGRRHHWHIDALTRRLRVTGVAVVVGGSEHALVEADLARGWIAVVPGFGSSDCRACPAHLLAQPPAACAWRPGTRAG